MDDTTAKASSLTIPVAIIIAGILIAGAVVYSKGNDSSAQEVAQASGSTDAVRPVSGDDHILGNPNAPVVIVEYSDFECPYCKRFHDTLNQVMDEYGKNGQVAWVYRQFPLDQLHPVKARAEAVASECAAELGGNDAFWAFADRLFELTLSNNQTDIDTVIPKIADEMGLNSAQFEACRISGKYDKRVESDIANAIATGGQGTPWSVIIAENGRTFPLSGAQPYTSVKQLIEIVLKEK